MLEKIDYEGANVWSISKPFRLGSAPDCMAADILRQIYQMLHFSKLSVILHDGILHCQ